MSRQPIAEDQQPSSDPESGVQAQDHVGNETTNDAFPTSSQPPPPQPKDIKRRMTVYQSRVGRPRWVLHMQAVFWRVLMGLGMFFHRLAPPRPPKPNFSRTIPSTLGARPGSFTMHFYVPRDYETQRRLWTDRPIEPEEAAEAGVEPDENEEQRMAKVLSKRLSVVSANVGQSLRRRSMSSRKWGGYPVIVNFHGGGFTLGSAVDDARWCGTVVDECNAVVVSVDYRLAPECPFPTAVEDGVDAVLYLYNHAEELGIDREKIGLSGFSSGGNMAFTVPLRLHDEIAGFPRDDSSMYRTMSRQPTGYGSTTALVRSTTPPPPTTSRDNISTSTTLNPNDQLLDPSKDPPPQIHATSSSANINQTPPPSRPQTSASNLKSPATATVAEAEALTTNTRNLPSIPIRCIIPWYPSLDYTRTREQRRATCVRKDQELPSLFTDLFDESYLHPPHTIALDSPYLSPGVAPTALLRDALPNEIIMATCEWDMLLDEGQIFRDRLVSPEIGKKVVYSMIPGVPHGWDKAPNPWKPTPGVKEHYLKACREIRRVMAAGPAGLPLQQQQQQQQGGEEEYVGKGKARMPIERQNTQGFFTAAPRESVSVVR